MSALGPSRSDSLRSAETAERGMATRRKAVLYDDLVDVNKIVALLNATSVFRPATICPTSGKWFEPLRVRLSKQRARVAGLGSAREKYLRRGFAPRLAYQLTATEADQHLDDARDLVLRADGVLVARLTESAKDVDRGGALHRRALSYGEEVKAITAGATPAAFGEVETNRCGSAFELVAHSGTSGFREGRTNERQRLCSGAARKASCLETSVVNSRATRNTSRRSWSRVGTSGAEGVVGVSVAFEGVRFKAGLLSKGTAQAPSSPGRTALCSRRGVPRSHDRDAATDMTATLKARGSLRCPRSMSFLAMTGACRVRTRAPRAGFAPVAYSSSAVI